MVSLSRPAFAAVPSTIPSITLGFFSTGTEAAHACTISSARSRNLGTSRPIAAAGTIPKLESAEYRPPIVGSPWKMYRNLSVSASFSSFDPGSVTAIKRLPAFSAPMVCFTRSKKYCLKIFGSRVVPDLLETINRLFARSSFFSNDLTWAGSVESSTCISGKPLMRPKVFSRTSGQRLDPPIPSRRISLNFSLRISSDSRWN